jgi:NAD(P)-dependent dehydrogenase (short-subunit alcohol dehydrogenase family)
MVAASPLALADTMESVWNAGGPVFAFPADLRDAHQVASLTCRVPARMGHPDILINTPACPLPPNANEGHSIDEWVRVVERNLVAVADLTFAFLPHLLDQSWGRVLNIGASTTRNTAAPAGLNAHLTSLAGLQAHTLALAAELDGTGVTVNVCRPPAPNQPAHHDSADAPPPQGPSPTGSLRGPQHPPRGAMLRTHAASIITRLDSAETGAIWNFENAYGVSPDYR